MFNSIRNVFKGLSENVRKISIKSISEKDLVDILDELTLNLLKNNVAFDVSEKIVNDLKDKLTGKGVEKKNVDSFIKNSIKNVLAGILKKGEFDLEEFINEINEKKPYLILFVGSNGSGKTTTISKFASYFKKKKIVMAAGDTFRDASIEQIQHHADKLGLKLIKHSYGSDSAAVIFDAKKYGETHKFDLVLGDTAGRSYANINLMDELKKVVRVNKPDKIFLVIDSLLGNDIVNQIENYAEIGFDGIILTKVDADSKGGSILNVCYLAGKPIVFLGVGQNYEDLEEFNAGKVVERFL